MPQSSVVGGCFRSVTLIWPQPPAALVSCIMWFGPTYSRFLFCAKFVKLDICKKVQVSVWIESTVKVQRPNKESTVSPLII